MHIENLVYFQKGQKGGNKMKKMEKSCRSDLKQLFTIHLFTFFVIIKLKNEECKESDAEERWIGEMWIVFLTASGRTFQKTWFISRRVHSVWK